MVDNIYAVSPNFPAGCLMSQLSEELVAVWPADVFPITTIHRGKPGAGGVITTGNLTIVTDRVLTVSENDAALDFFPTHVPVIGAQGGILIADLPAGTFQGETLYLNDQPRQGNSSTGGLCSWDGRDRTWRRVRDDIVVATIP